MLTLLKVKKYYERRLVLDIPQLGLDKNIYWAKGPNGSGKTTMLRTIAGLLPFEGDILLDDVSLKHRPVAYRRSISWADAEPLYPSFLTGSDLIRFYSNVRRRTAKEADPLVALLGMNDYIDQKTSTYSSGMMKKLSLTLALIGNADLMILDEPLITLDNHALLTLTHLILDRHSQQGTTFLLSSHMDLDRNLIATAQELLVRENTIIRA